MTQRWLIAGLMLALVTVAVPAEDPPAAVEPQPAREEVQASRLEGSQARDILELADAAMRKVTSVKYRLRSQRTDAPAEQAGRLSGTAILSGWNGETPKKFLYDVESHPGGGTETARIVVGFDGEQYWALNMRDKKVFAGPKIESLSAYQLLVMFFPVTEFVLPEPFGDELKATHQEMLGTTVVDHEPCYRVHVKYRSGHQEATWYFSIKDYLPRRVDRMIADPDGAMVTRSTVITELVVDPELDDDAFVLKIPENFVRADDALPARP